VLRLSIRKEERGRLNIHFAKWIVNADVGYQTHVDLLAGPRAGNGYLLYTRLLTLACGPETFF
jgi:hypothetical protein